MKTKKEANIIDEDNAFMDIFADLVIDEEVKPRNFIDTGSYVFNALLSGSIYGGFPDNRIIGLAGEEATGKTIFAMQGVKSFLDRFPDSRCLYFDTEGAVDKVMLRNRGIDPSRVLIVRKSLVESITTDIVKILDNYKNLDESKRKRMIIVLDSLGNVGTTKEKDDALKGEDKADMQRAKNIKKFFRIISNDMELLGIPMIVPAHVYEKIGSYVPTKEVGSGSGLKYMASSIIMFSKAQDKDTEGTVGTIITAKTVKSRFSKPYQSVKMRWSFETGLDRYYGLVDLAIAAGIWKEAPKRVELPDGTKLFQKTIEDNPTQYFTKEILDKIDEYVKVKFGYGFQNQEEEGLEE